MKSKHRVNDAIEALEVLLISGDGESLGVVSLRQALENARECGLDLVEIVPDGNPPVCKMMEYDKHRFNEGRKVKRKVQQTKEYKFRPSTGEHDYGVKLRAIRELISKGGRARVVLRFVGREIVHVDVGMRVVERVVEDVADIAKVESPIKMEGVQIRVLLIPKSL